MSLEQIYEMTVLKERLLNVAIMLQKDESYTKELAVEDLKKMIRHVDQSTEDI